MRESAPTVSAAPSAMPDVFDEGAFARLRQQRAAATEETRTLPAGARVAGAILLVNAVLQLGLRTVEPEAEAAASLAGPWTAAFDIVVGAVLLSNQSQVWRWTRVRLLFGGVALALLDLAQGRLLEAGLQIPFCAGLLLLLARQSPPWRLPLCAGSALAAMVPVLCSAAPFLGWHNPFGRAMGRLNGEISDLRVELVGAEVPFRLNLSPGRWHDVRLSREEQREVEATRDDGGVRYEMSAAVRRPESQLDLRLFALQAPPDADVDEEAVMQTLVDQARDGLPEFLVVEDEWRQGQDGSMRVLEGPARLEGRRVAVAVGLQVNGGCVFMLIGTAPIRMYDRVRDDLLEVYDSLQSPGC